MLTILIIIVVSIIAIFTIIGMLLNLFVSRVLKNDPRKTAFTLLTLLVLQFILGMLANLFAAIPKVEPWLVFHQLGFISVHTVNATILLILSVMFLFKARKQKGIRAEAIVGNAGILIAFASGVTFVNAGQNNIYSFTMALGFITAILSYAHIAFSNKITS